MAWRIDEAVLRGEIDNRVRGQVTGKIWFVGLAAPVELRLTGNCWRDLAGRRLEFTNPAPKAGDMNGVAALQTGAVGDITASRKVRVPDIPMDQIGEYYAAKKPFPWHWGNCLYLEWYGERNGRVVIESASYDLKIVGDATWEMTEAEEIEQRRANGEAIAEFLTQLTGETEAAAENSQPGQPPQTEEEAEKLQAESDRLADRIQTRLEREGAGADFETIMREELARLRRERGETEPPPEQLARDEAWVDAMNRAGRETVEEFAAEAVEDPAHPLAAKAQDLALLVLNETEENGWLREDDPEEHPVAALGEALFKASVKLAGALNSRAWPPRLEVCAGILVRLKKARGYFDDAAVALESCREQKLVEVQWLGVIVVDVTDLVMETDALIAQLRAMLERGSN